MSVRWITFIAAAGPQEFLPSQRVPSAQPTKTTGADERDKEYKKRAELITPADLNPQFVKVQTLTKGSEFVSFY